MQNTIMVTAGRPWVNGTTLAGDTTTVYDAAGVQTTLLGQNVFGTVPVNSPLNIWGSLSVNFASGLKKLGMSTDTQPNACSVNVYAGGTLSLNGTGVMDKYNALVIDNNISNGGTINLSNQCVNTTSGTIISGGGTINLTNVRALPDVSASASLTRIYSTFSSLMNQTVNLSNSDLSCSAAMMNLTVNMAPGTKNYFGISSYNSPTNIKVRGFASGSIIDFRDTSVETYSYNTATGILSFPLPGGATPKVTIDIGLGYNPALFYVSSQTDRSSSTGISYNGPAPCFLADTMIATPDGARPVQDLVAGDLIVTLEGGHRVARPIMRMVSQQQIVSPTLPDDLAGYAVCVARNALADNQPCKDMYLTSEHCLHLDGGLVPVRMLVNGQSVRYDRERLEYTYYHIDMGEHYIILADGVEVESYLPNLDELRISGADSLNYARVLVTPAAPLRVEQDFVEPLHRRIAARAGIKAVAAKPRKASNLQVMTADGRVHQPMSRAQGVAHFKLPAGTQHVTLISETMRPCDLYGAFVDDRRAFGTLIGAVTLRDAQGEVALTTHLEGGSLAGWHDAFAAGYRWTNGYAALALPARQAQGRDMVLSIHFMDEPQKQDNGVRTVGRSRIA